MVALAERIRARLAGPGGGAEEGEDSRQDMQDLLLSVGIASPVTRENAGALYHQQLSRQVSDGPRVLRKSSADDQGSAKGALSSADRRCTLQGSEGLPGGSARNARALYRQHFFRRARDASGL
jgi:hypothetical protein